MTDREILAALSGFSLGMCVGVVVVMAVLQAL